MKRTVLLVQFSIILFTQCALASTVDVATKINDVTVFIDGAQVIRTGKITVPAGKSTIRAANISPFMNGESLLVKGKGQFTLFSVNHQTDFSTNVKKDAAEDSLYRIKKLLKNKVEAAGLRLPVLDEMKDLITTNKNLKNENNGITANNLKEMLTLYNNELNAINFEKYTIEKTVDSLNSSLKNIELQIIDLKNLEDVKYKEVLIEIDAPAKTTAEFTISYLVSQAGWFPNYDLRVNDLSQPIDLTYKAQVFQNTGEDWNDVLLTFSNGQPNSSGVTPKLEPWYLNFKRNTVFLDQEYKSNFGMPAYLKGIKNVTGIVRDESGQPLPFANVVVEGTTIGASTDQFGKYTLTLPYNAKNLVISYLGYNSKTVPVNNKNMNITLEEGALLDEVVIASKSAGYNKAVKNVAKAKPPKTITKIRPTTFEFKIEEVYTIKSGGEKRSVNIANHKLDASYTHYAVPKLDETTYLMTSITNWSSLNLLDGTANIYFDDTYISQTVLEANSFTDTLKISLGQDKSIAIKRTKNKDFCSTKFFSGTATASIGFNIKLKNNRKQMINLLLYDQIPVSAISDIKVKPVELSKGDLNEESGEIKWKLDLLPHASTSIKMAYEVKHPRKEQVVLE